MFASCDRTSVRTCVIPERVRGWSEVFEGGGEAASRFFRTCGHTSPSEDAGSCKFIRVIRAPVLGVFPYAACACSLNQFELLGCGGLKDPGGHSTVKSPSSQRA